MEPWQTARPHSGSSAPLSGKKEGLQSIAALRTSHQSVFSPCGLTWRFFIKGGIPVGSDRDQKRPFPQLSAWFPVLPSVARAQERQPQAQVSLCAPPSGSLPSPSVQGPSFAQLDSDLQVEFPPMRTVASRVDSLFQMDSDLQRPGRSQMGAAPRTKEHLTKDSPLGFQSLGVWVCLGHMEGGSRRPEGVKLPPYSLCSVNSTFIGGCGRHWGLIT